MKPNFLLYQRKKACTTWIYVHTQVCALHRYMCKIWEPSHFWWEIWFSRQNCDSKCSLHINTYTRSQPLLLTSSQQFTTTFTTTVTSSRSRSQPLFSSLQPHDCHETYLCCPHTCALPNVPIPIKLPGDKSDTSPSAPDEPKHIYEHCHKPMHGGICGQNFKDVHGTL